MKSNVLLIDDDPIDLKAMQQLLESLDLNVCALRSAREALQQVASETFDLVISDLRMPEMSGEQLLQELRRQSPLLPVVLVTAHADVQSAVRCMKLGAYDYVVKPPDPEEFRLLVNRAIRHATLERENQFLRAQLSAGGTYGERLIGQSPKMLAVFDIIRRAAPTDSVVFITGETGTGKELIAQTLHFQSRRADHPFVALNCAALNPNVVESELFGHEKGAFTGALTARRGRFEEADGGTLFLDELSETTTEFQAKLLRVLQEGELERMGSNRKTRVNVRILASSHRDIPAEVKQGRFREDLWYRLNVITIRIPPLRERREDIPLLAEHFLRAYSQRYGVPLRTIAEPTMRHLVNQDWPGNVRELQHAIERAVVLSSEPKLQTADFTPRDTPPLPPTDLTLQQTLDKRAQEYVLEVLQKTSWRKGRASELLGIDRATLYRLLQKYNLDRHGV